MSAAQRSQPEDMERFGRLRAPERGEIPTEDQRLHGSRVPRRRSRLP